MMKRNATVDLFKYIAAAMIVAIHTTRTIGIDGAVGFLIINVLCRIAVPFFAVCSGFYLTYQSNIGERDEKIKKNVWLQEVKLCKLYLLWSAIYLVYSIPEWTRSGWFSVHAFVDFGVGSITVGSHYHLWYLLSLIYALPLFCILVYSLDKKWLLLLSGCLWIGKSLMYGYQRYLPVSLHRMLTILEKIPTVRDAIFIILPLLLLGAVIGKEAKKKREFYLTGLIVSFSCLCIEAFALKLQGQLAVSYIFFAYPTAYFLFNVVANFKIGNCNEVYILLGKVSMLVYCVHPIIGEVSDSLIKSNLFHYLLTLISSTLFGLFVVWNKKKHEVKNV